MIKNAKTNKQKVLIIDNENDKGVIKESLTHAGFNCEYIETDSSND